jgi:hypothetical protein
VEQPPDPEVAARLAAGRLAQVAALVEAGEALVAKGGAIRQMNEVIEGALRQLQGNMDAAIDDLDDQTAELERLASIEDGRAYAAASRAGAADPWPPEEGARELLVLARGGLEEAVGFVAAAAGSEDGRRVAAERDRLQARLDRLSSLTEDRR